jgi:hypothetical protein
VSIRRTANDHRVLLCSERRGWFAADTYRKKNRTAPATEVESENGNPHDFGSEYAARADLEKENGESR